MKKFITVVVILSLCMAFAGCTVTIGSANTPNVATNEPTDTIPETAEEAVEEAPPDIPNAKDFPEFEWPTFGAATKVPTPDWSNRGEILIDSETGFWGQVGYSTLDDYNAYIKACQDAGYIEDYYNVAGYMYYGANADGYGVQLTYNKQDYYMAIQVTAYASEWDKWWVEEAETPAVD